MLSRVWNYAFGKKSASLRLNQAVRLKPFGTQQSRQQVDKQQQSHDARQHNHEVSLKNDGG
jgi:hypothetical protein